MSPFNLLLLAASLIPTATATISFPCGRALVETRADPLLSPGSLSSHTHKVVGGNGFGLSETFAQARASTCSSCPIQQDLSSYWKPKLYHHNANGTFSEVLMANEGSNDAANSGFVIYYNFYNKNIQPFPEGFRMIAGDATLRSAGPNAANIYWDCGATSSSTGFPNTYCDSLVARVTFPSCWNNQTVAPPGFSSHVAYPVNGVCPPGFPVQLITIGYEAQYETNAFGQWTGNQPFVLSNGDSTGYSLHGDFLNGWDPTLLNQVIKDCSNVNVNGCSHLTTFTGDQMQACVQKPSEVTTGAALSQLPGCNLVTGGPASVPASSGYGVNQHC